MQECVRSDYTTDISEAPILYFNGCFICDSSGIRVEGKWLTHSDERLKIDYSF
jgi:hypothetical protein